MGRRLPVLRGNLDVIVLKALASGRKHGYEITTAIEARTGGALELLDSALYQSLYRLEARRLVEAEWGTTESHRTARYYRITPAGRRLLRAQIADWTRYARAVTALLES
jgi:transcriptional regulator